MIQVQGVALDDYFPPSQPIDLVKMDIEGGEVEAIAGMTHVQPMMLIELHDVRKPAIDSLLAAGYTFYDLNLFPLDLEIVRAGINHCVAAPIETPIMRSR
jgi:hypothetical protein